ncbi:MAG: methyltransferase domain-containing protein [Ferroplasma sp.]
MLILKSDGISGILNEKENIATIKNEEIHLPKNLVYEPGDSIKIKNQKFMVLNPDPFLFIDVTGRNTQAILPFDAAYIIYSTGMSSGMNVLESGVGTGSMSYSVLSVIGDSGKLFSMDINSSNINTARKNVSRFINTNNWETITGDVRSTPIVGMYSIAILDMPDPWNAISNIKKSIKPGGFIVTYSPNYNQAEKNVLAMEDDFMVIETVELIKRNILVRKDATRPDNNIIGHTAFITIAAKKSPI